MRVSFLSDLQQKQSRAWEVNVKVKRLWLVSNAPLSGQKRGSHQAQRLVYHVCRMCPRYVPNAETDDQNSGDTMGLTNLKLHCSKALSRQVIPLLSNQHMAEEVKECA